MHAYIRIYMCKYIFAAMFPLPSNFMSRMSVTCHPVTTLGTIHQPLCHPEWLPTHEGNAVILECAGEQVTLPPIAKEPPLQRRPPTAELPHPKSCPSQTHAVLNRHFATCV